LRERGFVKVKDSPAAGYRHEPSEEELAPHTLLMLRGHFGCSSGRQPRGDGQLLFFCDQIQNLANAPRSQARQSPETPC
jgi:hypothetical protein